MFNKEKSYMSKDNYYKLQKVANHLNVQKVSKEELLREHE